MTEASIDGLRRDLLDAQAELKDHGHASVILIIAGVDGAGRGETANLLMEWLDPHLVETRAAPASPIDPLFPRYARFWHVLPPRGRLGIFLSGWYDQPLEDRARRRIKRDEFDYRLDEAARFERLLADDGTVFVKIWLDLDRDEQGARLKALAGDPVTAWRVDERDWKNHRHYSRLRRMWDRMIEHPDRPDLRWNVVKAADRPARNLEVGQIVLAGLRRAAQAPPRRHKIPAAPRARERDTLFGALDLSQSLSDSQYHEELALWQQRLNQATRRPKFARHGLVCAFEGFDAAGKGGAIRRVTKALDLRQYTVHSIEAPTPEELSHHYLWRFWRRVPPRGRIALFDRSWYGRVLVERAESLATPSEWGRAYDEIVDFEGQIGGAGHVVAKFFLHVSSREQLHRFNAREDVPHKNYKLTPSDWAARKLRPAYIAAAAEMIERTSTVQAPWTVVEAEDKQFARIKILKHLTERIEAL